MDIQELNEEYKRRYIQIERELGRSAKFNDLNDLYTWYRDNCPVSVTVKTDDPSSVVAESRMVNGFKMETLVCQACGTKWTRQVKRGHKPRYCKECNE